MAFGTCKKVLNEDCGRKSRVVACSDADIAYIASFNDQSSGRGACRSAGGVRTAGQKPLYA